MTADHPIRLLALAGTAAVMLAAAGAASAQIQAPVVSLPFVIPAPPDLDPAEWIVERNSGQVIANTFRLREGYGRASVPDGRVSIKFREDWTGAAASITYSDVGTGGSATFYESLVAGASGTITLTLTGHALVSASEVVIPSSPSLTDRSWAGFSFNLFAEVFNPGGGGFSGGGGEARAIIEDRTTRVAPLASTLNAGTAGNHKAVISNVTLNGREGGVMTLTAWVNAGDRLRFTVRAGANGWVDAMPGAFAFSDLSNTGQMSISGSPGMTWTSETGVFLSAVPEPAPAALLAAGLLVLVAFRRAGSRTEKPARAASRA
jgi:hypothetical protein